MGRIKAHYFFTGGGSTLSCTMASRTAGGLLGAHDEEAVLAGSFLHGAEERSGVILDGDIVAHVGVEDELHRRGLRRDE